VGGRAMKKNTKISKKYGKLAPFSLIQGGNKKKDQKNSKKAEK